MDTDTDPNRVRKVDTNTDCGYVSTVDCGNRSGEVTIYGIGGFSLERNANQWCDVAMWVAVLLSVRQPEFESPPGTLTSFYIICSIL